MAAFEDGVPCWVDASLPDVEAGKRFYGELFGWTFGAGDPAYGFSTQAFLDGRHVAALVPKTDGRMPTVWNVYLATRDATATAARIQAAGGRLIVPPTPVGGLGTMATAMDPGNAVFGLWQPGSHRGFEEQGEPGSYLWTELYTRDKEAVDAFYQEVFGYGSHDAGAGSGVDFAMWSPAGEAVGPRTAVCGRAVMDDSFPAELPAHFLIYFAVEDCDETVAAARRRGGRTVGDPQDTPYGRFAMLVDDQGADFAVIDTSKAA
ncbi:VOC family protein [Streptomyces palmae]|uniref:VOC family protein n=1 Tax=Streptomyces palmae TaxID=1701085 RepID=A0A4Z0GU05_9ACTN|nr:VOC family protein [Streptomyces palmae]TGB00060.1 VOC family protein [Streptomyces palmae]